MENEAVTWVGRLGISYAISSNVFKKEKALDLMKIKLKQILQHFEDDAPQSNASSNNITINIQNMT